MHCAFQWIALAKVESISGVTEGINDNLCIIVWLVLDRELGRNEESHMGVSHL